MKPRKIGLAGLRNERLVAKKLGANTRPASGAIEGMKGDMFTDTHVIEHKSTKGDSLGVKFDWLAKITREARASNKMPLLAINFTTETGNPLPNGEWVAMRLSDFQELMDGKE